MELESTLNKMHIALGIPRPDTHCQKNNEQVRNKADYDDKTWRTREKNARRQVEHLSVQWAQPPWEQHMRAVGHTAHKGAIAGDATFLRKTGTRTRNSKNASQHTQEPKSKHVVGVTASATGHSLTHTKRKPTWDTQGSTDDVKIWLYVRNNAKTVDGTQNDKNLTSTTGFQRGRKKWR